MAARANGRMKLHVQGHSVNMSVNEVDVVCVVLNGVDLRLKNKGYGAMLALFV